MSFPVKSTVLAMSLAATAAFAQPGSGPARGMPPCQAGVACAVQPGNKVMQRGPRMQAMTPEQRQARMEQRIAQQEKMLQITAAQRPQWNAFVNAHKAMWSARMTDAERQQAATMTPDQRMKWHAQQMEVRAQQMNQMAGHVKALRDMLTPEQRTRFDQFHQGGPMGMGKGRMGAGRRAMGMGWCNGSPIAPAAKP